MGPTVMEAYTDTSHVLVEGVIHEPVIICGFHLILAKTLRSDVNNEFFPVLSRNHSEPHNDQT